jgi:hypothetical protein
MGECGEMAEEENVLMLLEQRRPKVTSMDRREYFT